jgi:hypothetical protein
VVPVPAVVVGARSPRKQGIFSYSPAMAGESARFEQAMVMFDAANGEDPNLEAHEGVEVPKELLYARRMSAWLEKLDPEAGEPLRLAVRCQHLCRWTIPRGGYPAGRVGYRQWRSTLAEFHARKAAEILRQVGYDPATVERIQALVRKEKLKLDPGAQILEDVACLVFLENYFNDFSLKHDEEKILDIIRKTWRKMSPRGRHAALALDLPERGRSLVEKALAGS